ncbi:MAG: protein translocase subunit SecD [Betaproteobacteria bacterium]|nr:protein translocase subunit SecD [Betaproteobacteria bacterium]MBL8533979.1 protein translocase subunit SecD [Betaproteobacteria bacterium]
MNRYPLWKYLAIGIVLLVGLLYAAPNIFGEVPAVQVSPVRAGLTADTALAAKVEETLSKEGVKTQGSFLEPSGVKVRFADPDTQLKAKDVLQKALGDDYVVALNLLSNAPGWMRAINALPMYLGLDLRGGVHFLMQVDMNGALTKAADRYASDVRQLLREKDVRYAGVGREGQTVNIRFRDEATRDKGLEVIERNLPGVTLKTKSEGTDQIVSMSLKPETQKSIQDFAVQQNITTMRNRVNELGVAEPIIQQSGADRIVVQLPGVQDTARAKDILGRTATLEVRMVDEEATRAGTPGVGSEVFTERQRDGTASQVIVRKQVVLTGERIVDAGPTFDQNQRPAVSVSLDSPGGRIMRDLTRENVGKLMAIILFEKGKGEAVSVARIQSEFSNRFQITGMFTAEETTKLAILLRAGSLAAPMEIVEERTVGPSMGAENIEKGWKSTLIGFTAIGVFMIIYYMLFGVISVMALAVNLVLLVALLSMLQATLTLPGIAAIALTLGMAIDANVLINERVREELRNGTTPQAAIAAGYERAWGTILDSNITTLIAGIALFMFGSGPIRGFAVVHCLGILTSMFSAVLVSRSIVNLMYGSRRKLDGLSIGNTNWHKQSAAPV